MNQVAEMDTPAFPTHVVLGGRTDTHDMAIQLIRCGSKFWIKVDDEDIKGLAFEEVYLRAKAEHSDGPRGSAQFKAWEVLCNVVIGQCLPLLQELAPPGKSFETIEDYWQTPIHRISLKSKHGKAAPEVTEESTIGPSFFLTSRPVATLDLLDSIPLVPASELSPVYSRDDVSHLPSYNQVSKFRGMPTKVRDTSGILHFFKPCQRITDYEAKWLQELRLLQQLHQLHNEPIHVPCLTGIVVTDDGVEAIGFLTEWIPGSLLANVDHPVDPVENARWKGQLVESLEATHTYGITWGEPHPHSIVIDKSGDAWMLWSAVPLKPTPGEKEGGHTVAEGKTETESEDLKNLRLLFDKRLPSQLPWWSEEWRKS